MKKLFLILVVVTKLFFPQSVGINFELAFPVGEFKEHLDRPGIGGNLDVTFWSPSKELPFSFGVDLEYLIYGYNSAVEPINSVYSNSLIDVSRTNSILKFHSLFRIDPLKSKIRPYGELLFGGSYLSTSTSLTTLSGEDIDSETNFDDWAWSYGGGAGILIDLISMDDPGENAPGSLLLNIMVRYLKGTEAEYLLDDSINITSGGIEYEVSKSKTDLLSFHLGVILAFNTIGSEEE